MTTIYAIRNSPARDHRQRPAGNQAVIIGGRPPRSPQRVPVRHRPQRDEPEVVAVITESTPSAVITESMPSAHSVAINGEFISFRRSLIADALPVVGQVLSAMYGPPIRPKMTGDSYTDHTNLAIHQEALAEHRQVQKMIETGSNLLGRLVNVLVS